MKKQKTSVKKKIYGSKEKSIIVLTEQPARRVEAYDEKFEKNSKEKMKRGNTNDRI